jgi:FeS assembly SUF system regulator
MIRISKLADYGTLIMSYLASAPRQAHNARDIATHTHIALPTVSKLLKLLANNGLLLSQRGVKGGYTLALPAEQISMAKIIDALDGSIALTECSHGAGLCAVEQYCTIRHNWRSISSIVHEILIKVTLAEMLKPLAVTGGTDYGNT